MGRLLAGVKRRPQPLLLAVAGVCVLSVPRTTTAMAVATSLAGMTATYVVGRRDRVDVVTAELLRRFRAEELAPVTQQLTCYEQAFALLGEIQRGGVDTYWPDGGPGGHFPLPGSDARQVTS